MAADKPDSLVVYTQTGADGRGSKAEPIARRPMAFTRRARDYAQRLVESENYRKWIADRIRLHTLDPSIERMLWAYAYGKPKEYIEVVTRSLDLSEASTDLLASRAEKLGRLLSQLSAATTKAEADRLISALEEDATADPAADPAVH